MKSDKELRIDTLYKKASELRDKARVATKEGDYLEARALEEVADLAVTDARKLERSVIDNKKRRIKEEYRLTNLH